MKYNPYLKAQWGTETPDEGTFPQYQYYPYLYDSTDVGSFPRTVPWSNPISNRMEMTAANEMQMFEEGSKKWTGNEIGINNYDRMFPDKSNIQDYIISPEIQPRESYQQTLLRDRIQPLQNFKIEDVIETEPTREYGNIKIQPGDFMFPGEMSRFHNIGNAGKVVATKPVQDYEYSTEDKPILYEEPKSTQQTNNASNYVKNWMGELFDPNRKKRVGDAGDDGDISNVRADYDGDISNVDPNKKNMFGVPEAYYIGKSMLDATALINNMVQPQPPSLQMKIPHYERQRLDPTPYDAMRSEMRNQGTQAYRLQRENISQASDLMKGLAAVTSGTQQGLMQVGMQQAGAEQQIQGINQQISMQEQGQQTEILNQEAMTNYQMQQQAQQFKDQMVSAQLNRLGDTAGAYSDYVVKKELAQRMTDMSKDQADKGNAIQIAMLKYQAGQNELGSDAFKEAQRQNINQYISETKSNLYKDPRYDKLRQKYGDNYDPLTIDTRESNIKNLEQRMNILSESYNGFTEEPQKPTRTTTMTDDQWKATEEDYEKRKWRFDSDKERYTTAKKQYDLEKPIIDLERSFVNELKSSYDVAGRRIDFQSEWFKKRGLKTMQETIEEVEALMNPNRQIFK
jgi:hypothetical protein